MPDEASAKDRDLNDADMILDLQRKLLAAQAEIDRVSIQRDYVVRLLRQQQTLTAGHVWNEKLVILMERNGIFARMLKLIPKSFKDMIPLPAKQFLKNIIVRIG